MRTGIYFPGFAPGSRASSHRDTSSPGGSGIRCLACLSGLLLCLWAVAFGADEGTPTTIDEPEEAEIAEDYGTCDAGDPADNDRDWSEEMTAYADALLRTPGPPLGERVQGLAETLAEEAVLGHRVRNVVWRWEWRRDWDWPRDQSEPKPLSPGWTSFLEGLAEAMGEASRVVLWLLLLVLLVWLWRFRDRLRPAGQRRIGGSERIAGIELEPLLTADALPVDVVNAAEALWQAGERRAALSLLYRAALARLGESCRLAIPGSGTEDECLRRVATRVDAASSEAFRALVLAWSRCAWAHAEPTQLAPLIAHYLAVCEAGSPAGGSSGYTGAPP